MKKEKSSVNREKTLQMRDATATDEIPVYSIGKAKPEALIVFEMPYSMRKASSLII